MEIKRLNDYRYPGEVIVPLELARKMLDIGSLCSHNIKQEVCMILFETNGGEEIFLNPEHIVAIIPDRSDKLTTLCRIYVTMILDGKNRSYVVKGSPREAEEAIRKYYEGRGH